MRCSNVQRYFLVDPKGPTLSSPPCLHKKQMSSADAEFTGQFLHTSNVLSTLGIFGVLFIVTL